MGGEEEVMLGGCLFYCAFFSICFLVFLVEPKLNHLFSLPSLLFSPSLALFLTFLRFSRLFSLYTCYNTASSLTQLYSALIVLTTTIHP
ncbi:hypothetical protein BKA57DRAFT_460368 [Linnemannia elongata]|nr:hypothetical protein BKA57DRAFT_460368 [Linnemannia elongata]